MSTKVIRVKSKLWFATLKVCEELNLDPDFDYGLAILLQKWRKSRQKSKTTNVTDEE